MIRDRLARGVLVTALFGVLGWPVLATVWAAIEGARGGPMGTGLIIPEATGGVRRPLGLAVETVRLVLATEALALPPGLLLALLLFRTDAWGRRGVLALLAVSAFVPLPLHATAWLGALGNAGRAQAIGASPVLVGWRGAAFVHASAALPWVVLLAGVGLRTVEPELEEAALLDRAGGEVALRVTLRRGIGAVAASAMAVAVLTAGDMTVTDLLQVRTYAEEAYLQYNLGNGPGAAAAVTLPPLLVLGTLIALGARGLLAADPARLATAATRARVWRLGRWRVAAGVLTLAVVGNGVALPLYSLVWRAGRVGGFAASGRSPSWSLSGFLGTIRSAWDEASGPLAESAGLAAAGASAAVALAWALAWVSRAPGPWRAVTAGAVALALAAPGPVAGMALVFAYRPVSTETVEAFLFALAAVLRAFPSAPFVFWVVVTVALAVSLPRVMEARWISCALVVVSVVLAMVTPEPISEAALGVIERVASSVYDSPVMVVLAGVLRTFPYALLIVWPAVRSVSPAFLDSASVDGMGPWGQAFRVALPLTRGAVVAAWGVAFALALGELPATNLVTPPGLTPISVVIWGLLHTGVESHLAGVVLVMLAAVSAAGLFAAMALGALSRTANGADRD